MSDMFYADAKILFDAEAALAEASTEFEKNRLSRHVHGKHQRRRSRPYDEVDGEDDRRASRRCDGRPRPPARGRLPEGNYRRWLTALRLLDARHPGGLTFRPCRRLRTHGHAEIVRKDLLSGTEAPGSRSSLRANPDKILCNSAISVCQRSRYAISVLHPRCCKLRDLCDASRAWTAITHHPWKLLPMAFDHCRILSE